MNHVLLLIKGNDLTLNPGTDGEEAKGRKRRVTPIGGTAGIEEEDAADDMTGRLMAVSINDAIDLFSGKSLHYPLFEIVLGPPAMDEANPLPRHRNNPPLWQFGRIEIAAHRQHRPRQKMEQLRLDDIAGMEDHLRPGKVLLTAGQQCRQPRIAQGQMSVGKDADSHEFTHARTA